MVPIQFTRRDFSLRLVSTFPLFALAACAHGQAAPSAPSKEVSEANEAIHQEMTFKASPKRVYEALTDPKQFHQIVQLSADGKAMAGPTEISPEVGGAFSLFGGHILGRHVELTPNVRLVQAWRVADWAPGVYSIAKFELSNQGPGTRLVFDHTGFPQGKGQHLADGWKEHYWEPLQKYLA